MKKKITKPKEILLLEKAYDLSLEEVEKYLNSAAYTLNADGKVIALNLMGCDIHELSPIEELTDLKSLNLTSNRITSISFEKLVNLEELYIGGNKISDFTSLEKCEKLKELAIWENPVDDLTFISKITTLQRLFIQRSGITSVEFLLPLKNLIDFSCESNSVTEVIIPKGNKKAHLNFNNNIIKEIDYETFKKFSHLSVNDRGFRSTGKKNALLLQANPLKYPPTSVIELGKENIENYYQASAKFGSKPISEGRIIVVGDGSAGKSSLIERLIYNTFESGKLQTNGVLIDKYPIVEKENRKLLFHIWDFGGQEIQHAVHKFFFNEGCLYILVLDNRKEEDPEYWLRQIESLGGSAPVLVVFNKKDENSIEITDRKFLKQKYSNIVGFHNTSCKTGEGVSEFKKDFEEHAIKLKTVDEKFPNNWFKIKQEIEACTSGQHYLNYETYGEICIKNNVNDKNVQKLLLKYFTTIGAVTWFGDTYLNFLHVLSPSWITQGVYKIITAEKTAKLSGQISISDFKELLEKQSDSDYEYKEEHYGYILSMMKKFDLCYTPDDKTLLLPSAFGKMPKLEYHDFLKSNTRTYILQFKDYMPPAILHKFMSKKLQDAYDGNFWFSGIVISDKKSNSLAMIHADRELKRIYIRIKGENKLGFWEHIRREFESITRNTFVNYSELIKLDYEINDDDFNIYQNENEEYVVDYEDLINHIQANKSVYFHAKLRKDFNVGYLIGLFEDNSTTIEKFKNEIEFNQDGTDKNSLNPIIVNILNQNTPQITTNNNSQINIDISIDIEIINNAGSEVKGDINYLMDQISESEELKTALQKILTFVDDTKIAKSREEIKEKGWGRKLKGLINTISSSAEKIKAISDGTEVLSSIYSNLKILAESYHLHEISKTIQTLLNNFTGMS